MQTIDQVFTAFVAAMIAADNARQDGDTSAEQAAQSQVERHRAALASFFAPTPVP
jgi:hypothetical protein